MDKAGDIEEVSGESDKMEGEKGKGGPSHPIPAGCLVLRHRRPFCLLFNARFRMHYTVYIIYISLCINKGKFEFDRFPRERSSPRCYYTLFSSSLYINFFNNLLAVSLTYKLYELMNKLSIKAAVSLSIFIKTFSYSEVSVLSFIST